MGFHITPTTEQPKGRCVCALGLRNWAPGTSFAEKTARRNVAPEHWVFLAGTGGGGLHVDHLEVYIMGKFLFQFCRSGRFAARFLSQGWSLDCHFIRALSQVPPPPPGARMTSPRPLPAHKPFSYLLNRLKDSIVQCANWLLRHMGQSHTSNALSL